MELWSDYSTIHFLWFITFRPNANQIVVVLYNEVWHIILVVTFCLLYNNKHTCIPILYGQNYRIFCYIFCSQSSETIFHVVYNGKVTILLYTHYIINYKKFWHTLHASHSKINTLFHTFWYIMENLLYLDIQMVVL